LLGAAILCGAALPLASPEGNWLTEKRNGIVEIYRCLAGRLCGRLVWLRIPPDAGNPTATDRRNPDPARRRQPLCGLVIMGGFTPGDPGEWQDGWIYDPESGSTYHATMALRADGRLAMRGYVGIPLFGESQVWTRFTSPVPPCPAR
jgi:uncharacterized protein (DUF2147 family)